MSYYKEQRNKAEAKRDQIFGDPGGGTFKKKQWPFVLKNPILNLHEAIREDAITYFNRHNIPLWNGTATEPTGHLLSSQVACLNHLFFVRQHVAIATAILQGIDKQVECALPIADGGFVDFEVIGAANYLGEKSHTRGANSTSIDAVMLAELTGGRRKLFFIEWKYTESYTPASKAEGAGGPTRLGIYTPHLQKEDCPIIVTDIKALFIEPYYQLMRQTLLAHEMVKAKEFGVTDYMHIHAIPISNKELKGRKTSAMLTGIDLDSAWKGSLKHPDKYVAIDPETLLAPARQYVEVREMLDYLQKRYWQ
jgi:hypothetical protein